MNPGEEQPIKPQKKVYSRKLTDKRREQNRQAQKNYRERQRRRIEELEKKVEEKNSVPSTASTFPPPDLTINATATGPARDGAPYGPAGETGFFTVKTFPDINFQPFEAGEEIPEPIFGDFELAIRTGEGPSFQQAQSQTYPGDEDVLFPTAVEGDAAALWPSPPLSEAVGGLLAAGQVESSASTIPVRYIHPRDHAAQSAPSNSSLVPVPSTMRAGTANPSRKSTEPALLDNHMILAPEVCLSAMFDVAAHLGITRESYAHDHQSPFYSPRVLASTGLPIDTVARIDADAYSYLQPDLQPSITQVAFPHSSYLDCIVWPRFRERALRAAIEGKLNHMEFIMDMINGGIVCWGNQQHRKGKGMDKGVAWDQRSWEAKPWFIKKWAWLVGGDDDEVARGSRWWRFMRGERDD